MFVSCSDKLQSTLLELLLPLFCYLNNFVLEIPIQTVQPECKLMIAVMVIILLIHFVFGNLWQYFLHNKCIDALIVIFKNQLFPFLSIANTFYVVLVKTHCFEIKTLRRRQRNRHLMFVTKCKLHQFLGVSDRLRFIISHMIRCSSHQTNQKAYHLANLMIQKRCSMNLDQHILNVVHNNIGIRNIDRCHESFGSVLIGMRFACKIVIIASTNIYLTQFLQFVHQR
mmetsp:Transcript_15145/g.22929  ORF Transcript_15145/g.22929 Transcript_15145/m.22929 type:complete len:226 (-) Transcript_15145:630-1307(-)